MNDQPRAFLQNSAKAQQRAREYRDKYEYDKSIREAQESIELALKAIFYAFDVAPPKSHNFSEDDFKRLLEAITKGADPNGPQIRATDFQKQYIYARFWGTFYETAKYGLEKLKIGPGNFFDKDEADLAVKHAGFCYATACTAVTVHAENAKKYKERLKVEKQEDKKPDRDAA